MMMGYDYERLDGAVAAQRVLLDGAAQAGQEPKLRERLYEIEKLLTDSNNVIRDSADRLFGSQMLKGLGDAQANAPEVAEPTIAMVIDRILNLTRSNRDEAMRFNRIG